MYKLCKNFHYKCHNQILLLNIKLLREHSVKSIITFFQKTFFPMTVYKKGHVLKSLMNEKKIILALGPIINCHFCVFCHFAYFSEYFCLQMFFIVVDPTCLATGPACQSGLKSSVISLSSFFSFAQKNFCNF
jgi:hypothetical protein